ncbi:MAG: hypothetical protein IT347_03220 [Candidatus Eisenbacteria bacterium]|nr:hypothetical protein [Candidatus Eisenbacteria bacterium]
MNSLTRLVAALCLFGSFALSPSARAATTFSGRVLDCNNQGVAGVNVTVALRLGASCGSNNSNNSILTCTSTDGSGYWSYTQATPLVPGGWAGNWCFNTYGNTYNGYCTNNLPCCNGYICIGGGTGITTPDVDGQSYTNLNIVLAYSGTCPAGGGGEGDPDPKLPH